MTTSTSNSSRTKKRKPTILILTELNKKRKTNNPISEIPRLDPRQYLQAAQETAIDARVVVADWEELRAKNGILYVERGITYNQQGNVEWQDLSLPVDFLYKRQAGKTTPHSIDTTCDAYLSLQAENIEEKAQKNNGEKQTDFRPATTERLLLQRLRRWYENEGNPVIISQGIIESCYKKSNTERKIQAYEHETPDRITRPETYIVSNTHNLLATLLNLRDQGYKGAFIKDDQGSCGKGISTINLEHQSKQQLEQKINQLDPLLVKSLVENKEVVVQQMIDKPYLVNGKKTSLRSIITCHYDHKTKTLSTKHVVSYTRLSANNYSSNLEDLTAQLPQDAFSQNEVGTYTKHLLEEEFPLNCSLPYTTLQNKICQASTSIAHAFFRKAHQNTPYWVIGVLDFIISQQGELYFLEANCVGENFRGGTEECDKYIRQRVSETILPNMLTFAYENQQRLADKLTNQARDTSNLQQKIELYPQALEIKPNHPRAQLNLAYTYFTHGQTEKGRELTLSVLAENPNSNRAQRFLQEYCS